MKRPSKAPSVPRRPRKVDTVSQMFLPPPQTVAPVDNAQRGVPGMFMPPQLAQHDPAMGQAAAKPAGRPAWADTLGDMGLGVGIGLLTGDNWGEGIGQGLLHARNFGQDRQQSERLAASDAREQQRFDYTMQKDRAATDLAASQTAEFNAMIDSMGLPPQQAAFLKAEGPGGASFKDLFPAADTDAPTVKDFIEGNQTVQKQWNPKTGTWDQVGQGPRFKENDSAGIQIDTNGDGIPDVTIGGTGIKPLSENASQATVRGTLIDQGIKAIEGINFDNVGTFKTATGSWLTQTNPLGEAVGQMILNDDEKKLLGAQGMIQEAVISAITGSAYNEEQKRNMRAAMVPLSTDGPSQRAAKLKAAAIFLKQMDRNSGYNRVTDAPTQENADLKSKYGLE